MQNTFWCQIKSRLANQDRMRQAGYRVFEGEPIIARVHPHVREQKDACLKGEPSQDPTKAQSVASLPKSPTQIRIPSKIR